MSVPIHGVTPGSPAARAGVGPGHTLLRVNGREIGDVLDYRFYMQGRLLSLELLDALPLNMPSYTDQTAAAASR